MTGYVWHTWLNTGAARAVPRSEIPDAAIAGVTPLIEADGVRPLPDLGADLIVTHMGRMLYVTVRRQRVLCVIGVAGRSRGAESLWRELHATGLADFATSADSPPRAPWCGLALPAASPETPKSQTLLLVGLSKALAWSWVEFLAKA